MFGRIRRALGRALAEPLLHFAVLGALILALSQRPSAIEISTGEIAILAARHVERTGHEPTERELRGLVEQLVDEEVLVREARRLGLDEGDPIIRRRIVQKMTFLTEDVAVPVEPSDEELTTFLAAHADAYRIPERVTFEHVFFHDDERIDEVVVGAMRALAAGVPATQVGEPLAIGNRLASSPYDDIVALFGPDFAHEVGAAEVGRWVGPFTSRFGPHLIRVEAREAARSARLDEVRSRVQADYLEEARGHANRARVAELRNHYDVSIEWPAPAALARAQ